MPGEGEFPFLDLLTALPVGTPLSVEVPDARLQASLSPLDFAARNREAVRRLVQRAVNPAG